MPNTFKSTIQKHEKSIGLIASTFSILMFFSLVEILVSNFQQRSDIYIQPIATVFNGVFWATYGYGKNDKFILVPNVIAAVLGILTAISAFV